MSVSLLTVWRAARARALPFPGESAGYLVLLACEELAAAPRGVNLANVGLESDGRVWVRGRDAADDERAARDLRGVLRQLVEVASTPGIALVRAAQRTPGGTLSVLSSELAKALIPFNRAAARRALTRLYRETERAVAAGELSDEEPSLTPSEDVPAVREQAERSPLAPALSVEAALPPLPAAVRADALTPHVPAVLPDALTPHVPAVRADAVTPKAPALAEQRPEPPASEPEPAFTLPLVVERASRVSRVNREPEIRDAPADSGPRSSARPLAAEEQSGVITPSRIVALDAPPPLALPEPIEQPTRPEPLAARRRLVPPVQPVEGTRPLFLGTAFGREASAPSKSSGEKLPPYELPGPAEKTPPIGSFAPFPFDDPFLFDQVPDDETTERVPPVAELDSELPEELPAWPIELANRGRAIPLEPERDALPSPSASAASYVGMSGEKSDVRKLVTGFQVAAAPNERDLRGELKRLAGLDETPKPGATPRAGSRR